MGASLSCFKCYMWKGSKSPSLPILRDGCKTCIYLKISGKFQDNCNCDGYATSIFTLSVSSASENGQNHYHHHHHYPHHHHHDHRDDDGEQVEFLGTASNVAALLRQRTARAVAGEINFQDLNWVR